MFRNLLARSGNAGPEPPVPPSSRDDGLLSLLDTRETEGEVVLRVRYLPDHYPRTDLGVFGEWIRLGVPTPDGTVHTRWLRAPCEVLPAFAKVNYQKPDVLELRLKKARPRPRR